MDMAGPAEDNHARYTGSLRTEKAGRYGFTVRVVPATPTWSRRPRWAWPPGPEQPLREFPAAGSDAPAPNPAAGFASQRPVKLALPGPCSRNEATPMQASSVSNAWANSSCSSDPGGQRAPQPLVDGPLGQAVGHHHAPGQLGGRGEPVVQLVVGHHLVDQADAQRLVGPHLAAGQDQILGQKRPHQPGEGAGCPRRRG